MDVMLVGFKPDGNRVEIALSKPATIFGRGAECDIQVPVSSISRQHCEISIAGDQVWVADLGSSNGTFVNNDRVEETRLTAGDRLVLGPLVLTVQIDGVPADISSPDVSEASAPADAPEDDALAMMPAEDEDPLALLSDDAEEDPFAFADAASDGDDAEVVDGIGLAPAEEVAPSNDDPFAALGDDDDGDDDDPFAALNDDEGDDQPLL
jgi:predicted component of type VI protein secretion system